MDTLLAANAKLETLYRGDAIFEGPTWVRTEGRGFLLFSDVPGNVINKLDSDGNVSVFLGSIFSGKDMSEAYQSFGVGGQKKYWMIGPNGVTLDSQGRVVYCSYSDGLIVRLESDGRRTVLANRSGAGRLNAPNDLVYQSDGSLYFTDSRSGTRRSDGDGIPYEGLYMLRAGEVRLLSNDIDHPNGLAFSPDERFLYVTNSRLKNILRFDVLAGGIANEIVFVDMSSDERPGAPDGVKTDELGNVYSSGPGGVWIVSVEGKHIGTILTPEKITNIVFGGDDSKMLFLTGFGSLYRISVKVGGS